MGKPKVTRSIKVKLPKRLQNPPIRKRKSNNFKSKTVGKLNLELEKLYLKKFPGVFEDPSWDGDDEASILLSPIKLRKFKKFTILSIARKEKLLSFRDTSQKYPGIYGNLGSQKWIQHLLTFLNDDKVGSKDVQKWIEKYDWICKKDPSIIPERGISYSPDSDSGSDMDNTSVISDSGINGETRFANNKITARTFEDAFESYMDSGIVKRKSKIVPRDLRFSSCEDFSEVGSEVGQNQSFI